MNPDTLELFLIAAFGSFLMGMAMGYLLRNEEAVRMLEFIFEKSTDDQVIVENTGVMWCFLSLLLTPAAFKTAIEDREWIPHRRERFRNQELRAFRENLKPRYQPNRDAALAAVTCALCMAAIAAVVLLIGPS